MPIFSRKDDCYDCLFLHESFRTGTGIYQGARQIRSLQGQEAEPEYGPRQACESTAGPGQRYSERDAEARGLL